MKFTEREMVTNGYFDCIYKPFDERKLSECSSESPIVIIPTEKLVHRYYNKNFMFMSFLKYSKLHETENFIGYGVYVPSEKQSLRPDQDVLGSFEFVLTKWFTDIEQAQSFADLLNKGNLLGKIQKNSKANIGDLVIQHYIQEDAGIDCYLYFNVVNYTIDNDQIVHLLKSTNNKDEYIALTDNDFEKTFSFYEKDIDDDVIEHEYVVFDINEKSFSQRAHSENFIKVSINVFRNQYIITVNNKVSDKVISDIKNEINNMINDSNFKQFIGKTLNFKVRWKNDSYRWDRI